MLLLCQALDVNLAWLIGMDVPMEKDDDQEGRILECARRIDALDPEKRKSLFDFLDFLEAKK